MAMLTTRLDRGKQLSYLSSPNVQPSSALARLGPHRPHAICKPLGSSEVKWLAGEVPPAAHDDGDGSTAAPPRAVSISRLRQNRIVAIPHTPGSLMGLSGIFLMQRNKN